MNKYQEAYEERAAFHEFEGNLPREEAERRAFLALLADFISDNYPTAMKKYIEAIKPVSKAVH